MQTAPPGFILAYAPGGATPGCRRAAMNNKLIREVGRSLRQDILTTLKRRGSMTVKELAAHLRMSYMGVKQPCLDLEKDGYLDAWRRPPTRSGRPELFYRLTRRAYELFPEARNPLTLEVLECVQQAYGPAAPTKILFGIFAQRTEAYRARLPAGTLRERADALAKLRDADGYMSDLEGDYIPGEQRADAQPMLFANGSHEAVQPASQSMRIIERFSPIEDLLRRYPILARLEKEMFERLLDCPIRREEEPAEDAYLCIFHLR